MSNHSGVIQASIMRDMKEGVMTIGMDGIISFVNPAAEKILEKTAEELLGQRFAACFFQYEENDEFNQTILDAIYDATISHQNVVAYYTVHGCTGCPFATSFENARVGNGVLYIDMCDVDHWGNDALTGALHFIYIPKEAVTGEINKVVIVKGPNFLTP